MSIRTKTLVVGLSSVALIAGGSMLPAHATLPPTVSATIVASKCGSWTTWTGAITVKGPQGALPSFKPKGHTGQVRTCVYKYKLKDSDKKFDYYIADVTREFKSRKKGSEYWATKSPWSTTVSVNAAAQGGQYTATKTFKKPFTKAKFGVGFSFAGLSLSLPIELNGSTTVTRNSANSTSAKWTGDSAYQSKLVTLAYGTKVKAMKKGKHPKVTVKVTEPNYKYEFKKTTGSARGYSYPAYTIKKTISSSRTATLTL